MEIFPISLNFIVSQFGSTLQRERALCSAFHHRRQGLLPDLEIVREAPSDVTRHQNTTNQDTTMASFHGDVKPHKKTKKGSSGVCDDVAMHVCAMKFGGAPTQPSFNHRPKPQPPQISKWSVYIPERNVQTREKPWSYIVSASLLPKMPR